MSLTTSAVCRFWAALILNDLIQEMPVSAVAEKYGLPRGQLQGLQDRAGEHDLAFCILMNNLAARWALVQKTLWADSAAWQASICRGRLYWVVSVVCCQVESSLYNHALIISATMLGQSFSEASSTLQLV
jgi:hypothetical protein